MSAGRARRRIGRMPAALVIALGVVALVASIAAAMTLGAADVSLVTVRDIVLNNIGLAHIPVRPAANAIVWEDRLPRALVAAACGAGHRGPRRNPRSTVKQAVWWWAPPVTSAPP